MTNRRSAIKIIFLLFTVAASYILFFRWLPTLSAANLAVLKKKRALIAEIAEIIIPRTETPGAKDAGVDEFIIRMIQFCSDKKTQNNFISGLEKLEDHSLSTYDLPFISCVYADKLAMLTYFENSSRYKYNIFNKVNNRLLGKPFIIKFKELTVEGYCTSRLGATQGLAYDPVPGSFEACITIKPNQVSWATK